MRRWDSRLPAKTGSCPTHVEACGFYSCPPPRRARKAPAQSRNTRGPGLWVTSSKSPTLRQVPVSQMCVKCWCVVILWGRPRAREPCPLGRDSSRILLWEGRAQPLGSHGAGRKEGPASATTAGAGEEGVLHPCERKGDGEEGEPLVSKNGAAPPALIFADLEAGPGGHLKHLPHPFLGLG